jgi:two-component system cell cycle response regulator
MDSHSNIAIVAFGMSEQELRLLRTVLTFAKERSRTYELTSVSAVENPDFAIVDGDDPKAVIEWNRFRSDNPTLPVVTVGNRLAPAWGDYHMSRPLRATRLLAALDQVALNHERPAFAHPAAADTEQAVPVARHEAAGSDVARPQLSPLAALVVDDSLPIREQIKLELEPLVGHVDVAADGERAIQLLGSRAYDIVFLDVVLPGMDGYQICRAIKRDPDTKGTAVIMLTGKSSPFDRVKGKLAGCDTYLTKPVDHTTFHKVVRQYSTRHQ